MCLDNGGHFKLWEAFLWEETRRVDKTGCVKLNGLVFDVGPEFVGKHVDLRFDPFDMGEIEVWFNTNTSNASTPESLSTSSKNDWFPLSILAEGFAYGSVFFPGLTILHNHMDTTPQWLEFSQVLSVVLVSRFH